MTGIITNSLFYTHWHTYWLNWRDFCSILLLLETKADIERLALWAKRKRLAAVAQYYRRLLLDVEIRLSHKQMRFRRMIVFAEWVHSFTTMLFPSPHYYSKGAASKYKVARVMA
jgi:hypothetical protein